MSVRLCFTIVLGCHERQQLGTLFKIPFVAVGMCCLVSAPTVVAELPDPFSGTCWETAHELQSKSLWSFPPCFLLWQSPGQVNQAEMYLLKNYAVFFYIT